MRGYLDAPMGRHPAPMGLVLAYRWLAFAWMALIAGVGAQSVTPVLSAVALLVTLGWTLWLTLAAVRRSIPVLVLDLTLAVGLVLAGGLIHPHGHVLTNHPSITSAYPMAAVAAWAAVHHVAGGIGAGLVVAGVLPLSYALNGAPLLELSFVEVLELTGTALAHVLLGASVGLAARQFTRLAEHAARAGDQAARLAERERLAARIHDEVLQQLAAIHRGGADLAAAGPVAAGDLRPLLAEIRRQERNLRNLVVPQPDPVVEGEVSLTAALERLAAEHRELDLQVVTAGPVPVAEAVAAELLAAVREALSNVVKHARARRVWLSVLEEAGAVTVVVRDNGIGFDFDEDSLRANGRLGLLLSVRARLNRLGGVARIHGRPGRGTEVELSLPPERRSA
ncbi:sensor histidine kinase [Crossiella cryophila]|uniref:Signal transduction histidine kinase n=1 Tax=Crossiella cryophila TaxID=43355 RepID=A0A7W7CFR7_9PSEU|nr:ATP-binding protein [Crossiella cryophila]MBB4680396.1 signal transduction histidine kinase [Crossiella cryophila]